MQPDWHWVSLVAWGDYEGDDVTYYADSDDANPPNPIDEECIDEIEEGGPRVVNSQ
jgi:hypothetical protein